MRCSIVSPAPTTVYVARTECSSSPAQFGVAKGVVRGALAAKEAGEGDDLVDDGQIGVEMGVFFEELRQFAAGPGRYAFDAANGEVRMKAALLFAVAELGFQGVVDLGLQLFQLVGAVFDANPERSRSADWERHRRRGR